MMRNFIAVALLLLLSIGGFASESEKDIFEVETEGSYQYATGSPPVLAKAVALFNAKRKAVELAGRYLSRNSRIPTYELKKDEIYCLAAREIRAEILKEKQERGKTISTYRIRIRARVKASDFIKAEMEDIKLEKNEEKESFQEEMEQHISPEIDPGKDIAKAYRLLREKKWRIAMIYLNHLSKKYPNWDSIYMIKAITHYVLHEPAFMKKSLSKACSLGNPVACEDLKNLKKLDEHDFGLSTVD
ncbi:MAG: hypothetical protein P8185_01585 [Deltaproteobacteria bacterium]|jgi:hypothetical protein